MTSETRHIIHFTRKFETLQQILRASFLSLNYCEEDFWLGEQKISSAAHPMISFSEFSNSQIDSMQLTYGQYGVGFSRAWAHENGLHRILYLDPNSLVAESLSRLLRARQNQESSGLPDNLRLPIMMLKCFTKNATGKNTHLGVDNFDFAAENEWRFVPTKAQIGRGLISQNMSTYRKSKQRHNEKLKPYPLGFKRADISAITLSHESEADLLVREFGLSRQIIRCIKVHQANNNKT